MWQKNGVGTWFHIHMAAVSTWRYVVLVEKIPQPTPKQTPQTVANPKSNRPQLPPCGVP
ncbi:MAG: hypothetical protein M1540_01320 [Candidatus Bathyarchaeota archaeon]|nr:hypothetical protein [Candidatus Bathyarchaeota archaeon]